MVIDNGSSKGKEFDESRIRCLESANVSILRQPHNLGFAPGHNLAIRRSIQESWDYVWLVNSDAKVGADVLDQLVGFMEKHPECGVVSPLIATHNDDTVWDFCGAVHEWSTRTTRWARGKAEGLRMESAAPDDFWIVGTAMLFRTAALRAVGGLDERYFAYFEDNDICVRLGKGGWSSRICDAALIRHGYGGEVVRSRPDYYYYLMTRNSLMFWWGHTPKRFRKFLFFKLLNNSLFEVNKLRQDNQHAKADAALKGLCDFLSKHSGKPRLEHAVPWWGRLMNGIANVSQRSSLKRRALERAC